MTLPERSLHENNDGRYSNFAEDLVPVYDPLHPFAEADTPTELLGLLAGAASVCWNPPPTGEYDADRALALVDAAIERLIELGWDRG